MRCCSVALTTLALAASALAVPQEPVTVVIANVNIVSRNGQTNKYQPRNTECVTYEQSTTPINRISLSGVNGSDPTCTFYANDDCTGNAYLIQDGTTVFNTTFDMRAGSFSCDDTTSQ